MRRARGAAWALLPGALMVPNACFPQVVLDTALPRPAPLCRACVARSADTETAQCVLAGPYGTPVAPEVLVCSGEDTVTWTEMQVGSGRRLQGASVGEGEGCPALRVSWFRINEAVCCASEILRGNE